MMNIRNTIPAAVLMLCMGACANKSNTETAATTPEVPVKPRYELLQQASWLLGSWQSVMPEGTIVEEWKTLNDSVFSARSFFVSGKDTSFGETITLEQKGKELYYIPVVKDQNEGKPVPFRLSSPAGAELAFENPGHDFPQKIVYKKITEDSLLTEVSGNMQGRVHSEKLPMTRR
ncbi:MAG: hypothetical protein IBJ09_16055 [Bacteroidia bacterium]|nr:hypothetical protein [Bacteroidia bacterium]